MTFLAAIWSEPVYLVPAWKRRTAVLPGLSSSCGSGAYAEFMFFQPFLPIFHQLRVGFIFIGLLPLNLLGRTLWFFEFFLFGYVKGHQPTSTIGASAVLRESSGAVFEIRRLWPFINLSNDIFRA